MFMKIHVLHIKESRGVYGVDEVTDSERTNLITSLCEKYGISYTVIPIESIYSSTPTAVLDELEPDMDAPKYKTFHPDLPKN